MLGQIEMSVFCHTGHIILCIIKREKVRFMITSGGK